MLYKLVLVVGIILIGLTIYALECKHISIARTYPITALIFMVLYLFIIPLDRTPDAGVHFLNTFKAAYDFSISDIAYFLPAISCRAFGFLGAERCMFTGALLNVLLFVALSSYAIYKLPFGKRTMYIICLLPITMQQVASLSYDGPVMASVIVITALSLRWRYLPDPKIPHKRLGLLDGESYISNRAKIDEVIMFICASIVLLNTKGGAYAPIILMPVVLFINVHWFKNGRGLIFLGLFSVIILGVVLYLTVGSGMARIAEFLWYTPYIVEREAFALPPIYYLISPDTFIYRLKNTFSQDGRLLVYQMFGGILGSLNIFTWNPGVHGLFWLFVISLIRRDNEHRYIAIPRRIVIFIMASIPNIIAVIAMLFYWTPVDAYMIEGLQGRYFLPTLFLMSVSIGYWKKPAISNAFIKKHEDTVIAVLTLFFVTAMSLSAITFQKINL